jgi:hypothetical protein
MDDIIPQSFNDKLNVLFKYINNLYNSFANLTANYFIVDDKTNQVSVKSKNFTIDTDEKKINLGNILKPDINILYTNDNNDIKNEITAPNGSLFLSNSNNGEAYIKLNKQWINLTAIDNFKLESDTNIASTSELTKSNFFNDSNLKLGIGDIYEIEYNLYLKKKDSIGSVTFVLEYEYQPEHHIIHCNTNNKVSVIPDTTIDNVVLDNPDITYTEFFYNTPNKKISIQTDLINIDDIKYVKINIFLTNLLLENNLTLSAYNSAGSIDALKNSYWKCKKISKA